MHHSKVIRVLIFSSMTIFLILPVSFAKIVTLKNGETLEGEVMGSDDSAIRVKIGRETRTFSRIEIKSIKELEPRGELLASPDKIYKSMVPLIKQDDAEAHYRLGLFCLERGLPDRADFEFNKAKRIGKSYEDKIQKSLNAIYDAEAEAKYDVGLYYYNNGEYEKAFHIFEKAIKNYLKSNKAEELQKMLEHSRQETALLPAPLTVETAKQKLENWDLPVPYRLEDQNKIAAFILALFGGEKKDQQRKDYCAKYLDMGKNYLKTADAEDNPKRWRDLYVALSCYRIGNSGIDQRNNEDRHKSEDILAVVRDIMDRLSKNFIERLSLPENLTEFKAMKAFLEELTPGSMEASASSAWYCKAAIDYESKAKDEASQDQKKEYQRTAANCYLILTIPSLGLEETERVGLYGWARCFEELEKLK